MMRFIPHPANSPASYDRLGISWPSNDEQSKSARIWQSPAPWHPNPHVDRMLGATDLSAILGVRSVLALVSRGHSNGPDGLVPRMCPEHRGTHPCL
jgi:hypothetical protein